MSINNDRGFFVVLMVALVSFALWATMSTMHIYSVNKMEAHAKAKEANEMYNTLSDFAAEAQAGYYRSVIENQGEEGDECPGDYQNCTLDEGGGTKPNLCLKEKSCNTCLDASNGKNVVEYCGNFFGFSGKDDLGDCSDPKVLCVAASIDVADRKNPPSSSDLKDCDTCFVQPFKIFVDTPGVTNTTETTEGPDCSSICMGSSHPYTSNRNLCVTGHQESDGCTCYKGTSYNPSSPDTCGASCTNGQYSEGEKCPDNYPCVRENNSYSCGCKLSSQCEKSQVCCLNGRCVKPDNANNLPGQLEPAECYMN